MCILQLYLKKILKDETRPTGPKTRKQYFFILTLQSIPGERLKEGIF